MPELDGFRDCDVTGLGLHVAGDDFEQRCLAAAVVPDQPDALAAVDREVQMFEQHTIAEALVDVG